MGITRLCPDGGVKKKDTDTESSCNQRFPHLCGPLRKQHRYTSQRCFISFRRFDGKISSRFKPSSRLSSYIPKLDSLLSDLRGNSATNRCFNRLFLAGNVGMVSSFGPLTKGTAEAVLSL